MEMRKRKNDVEEERGREGRCRGGKSKRRAM